MLLATVHRAENTDAPERLSAILDGLCGLADSLAVVLPLHPRTRRVLVDSGELGRYATRLHLIDPVGYLDMLMLEKNAALIATDSGGIQKEAFFYKIPCVTLRDQTEWVELVDFGWNLIVPPISSNAVADGLGALPRHHRPRCKPLWTW